MASIAAGGSFAKTYLTVVCPCGRSLRARSDMAGTEIVCWDCHKHVRVPYPRASAGDTAHALRIGWDTTWEASSFGTLAFASGLVSIALCVPRAAIPLGAAVLVLAAAGYGELIRRGSRLDGVSGETGELKTPATVFLARGLATLLLGLGLAAPFLLSPGGFGHAARVVGPQWWVPAAAAAVILPLAMATAFAQGPAGPIGLRGVLSAAWQHPCATVAALAIVPLGAALLEAFLFAVSYHFGWLVAFLFDLYPKPEGVLAMFGLPPYAVYEFGIPPTSKLTQMYMYRLGQGYTLLGAIPTSVASWFTLPPGDRCTALWRDSYFFIRLGMTFVITLVMLSALALQARWLALICALSDRRASPAGARGLA